MLVVLFLVCLLFISFMLAWNFNELPSYTKKLLVILETRLILKII